MEIRFTEISIEQLVERLKTSPGSYAFLLGAGCSNDAGIPIASGVVEEIRHRLKKDSGWNVSYGEALQSLGPPSAQQNFLKGLIQNKKPSVVHTLLGQLLASRFITTVFTTNFDRLIETAAIRYDRDCLTISHDGIARDITAAGGISDQANPSYIVKLHGDYLLPSGLKNQPWEVAEFTEGYKAIIDQWFAHKGLVVVGYGQGDAGVRRALERAAAERNGLPLGLIWVIREGSTIPSWVEDIQKIRKDSWIDLLIVRDAEQLFRKLRDSLITDQPERIRNLPNKVTSFIGRDELILGILARLKTTRLLTLQGAGGMGKTRIALEVAHRVHSEFRDGVYWVELGSLGDEDLVPQNVASSLGVQEEPDRPLVETLAAALTGREILLVLNNCEQVIVACADLMEKLLRFCHTVQILVTSQEILGIEGEVPLRVPRLSIPNGEETYDISQLAEYDSIKLFVERAKINVPGFSLTNSEAQIVALICRRLDGIPLAIELAAARLKLLPAKVLLQRLEESLDVIGGGSRTALPRHQTLLATIEWSYQLASKEGQRLLNRIAIFTGGANLESVEAVCSGHGIEKQSILDILDRLVDKSLLTPSLTREKGARFELLETIRQFTLKQLGISGEAESIRDKHAEYFLFFAERAHPQLRGTEQALWLNRLEEEHDNLRASLKWYEETKQTEKSLRLASALGRFWHMRGYWREGQCRIKELLKSEDPTLDPSIRAKALTAIGHLAFVQGHFEETQPYYDESLAIRRNLRDNFAIADSLHRVGILAEVRGKYEEAIELQSESFSILEKIDNNVLKADVLHHLSVLAGILGQHEEARARHEQSLTLRRNAGDRWGEAWSLVVLGNMLLHQGNGQAAKQHYEDSVAIYHDLGDKRRLAYSYNKVGIVYLDQNDLSSAEKAFSESLKIASRLSVSSAKSEALTNLGVVSHRRRELEKAKHQHTESLNVARQIEIQTSSKVTSYNLTNAWPGYYDVVGDRAAVAVVLDHLADLEIDEGNYDEAEKLLIESLETQWKVGERWRIANTLDRFAWLAAKLGNSNRALILVGAAAGIRNSIGAGLTPGNKAQLAKRLSLVLHKEAVEVTQTEGSNLSIDEAVKFALQL